MNNLFSFFSVRNQRRSFLSTKRIHKEVGSICEKTSQGKLAYALSTARASWVKFAVRQEQKLDEDIKFEEIGWRPGSINASTGTAVGLGNHQKTLLICLLIVANWSFSLQFLSFEES